MLRNKYFAIAISLIALIVVLRTVIIMSKKKNVSSSTEKIADVVEPAPLFDGADTSNRTNNKSTTPAKKIDFFKKIKVEDIEVPDVDSFNWTKDPFYYEKDEELNIKNESSAETTTVFLKGIIIDGDLKKAIVNGKTLSEGERIGKIYIKEIGKDYIIANAGGEEVRVNMFEKITIPIKQKTAGGEDEK